MKPLNYALIGVTGIGGYHLATLRDMEKLGVMRLSCVVDPALAHNSELQAGFTKLGVRFYFNYTELLQEDVDVVVISVPIPFHYDMTLDLLKRDVFIYLEKPPVPLIHQLETLIAADKLNRVGVGFQMIAAEWLQEMQRLIQNGKLGEVQEIRIAACWPRMESYYRRNAAAGKMSLSGKPVFDGPATNALAHLLHNAMFLAGPNGEYSRPFEVEGELYRSRSIESYDTACLRGAFRSGIRFSALLTHSTEMELPYLFEVSGSKGWVRVSENGAVLKSNLNHHYENKVETFETLLRKTHDNFLKFVKGEIARPMTSLSDTRGYVLATNGTLISSGGISTIPGKYVRKFRSAEEEGVDIINLRKEIENSFPTNHLFSEFNLPWGKKSTPVEIDNLKLMDFDTYQ